MRELRADTCQKLLHEAIESLKFSYTPYSGFKVGAALLTKDFHVYNGCNIENVSFTPTNCAERTAFFKAISEGKKDFLAIAIVGGQKWCAYRLLFPLWCGRQVMLEFCNPKKFFVILGKSETEYQIYTLEEFIPNGFGPGNLN